MTRIVSLQCVRMVVVCVLLNTMSAYAYGNIYTTVSVVRLGCCVVSLYVYVVDRCGKRDCLIFPMQF